MKTDPSNSILETHCKTVIVLVSFAITVSGWWAWNAFLSGVYAPAPTPYGVRNGFVSGFGKDPSWWLTLVVVLFFLAALELTYKAVKRFLIVTGAWGRLANLSTKITKSNRRTIAASTDAEQTIEVWQEKEKVNEPYGQPVLLEALCEVETERTNRDTT
jgi:phospholipid-translocating ATPase